MRTPKYLPLKDFRAVLYATWSNGVASVGRRLVVAWGGDWRDGEVRPRASKRFAKERERVRRFLAMTGETDAHPATVREPVYDPQVATLWFSTAARMRVLNLKKEPARIFFETNKPFQTHLREGYAAAGPGGQIILEDLFDEDRAMLHGWLGDVDTAVVAAFSVSAGIDFTEIAIPPTAVEPDIDDSNELSLLHNDNRPLATDPRLVHVVEGAIGVHVQSRSARTAQLLSDPLPLPLFAERLLGTKRAELRLPERLLLRGVPGAGKTVTSFLLLEGDDRDVVVIESIAEPAEVVQAAGRGLPILFENATRDDARTIMRFAQQLGPIPLIVTTSDEQLTLSGFTIEQVPHAEREYLRDVVQHYAQRFGVSLSYPDEVRIVDRLEEERPETMAGIIHHAARALGHHVPYDPMALVERWRALLPPKDNDRWNVLRAIGELSSAPREETLPIPRSLIERYSRAQGFNPRALDALHHEGWVFIAGSTVHVPEVQREALGLVLWDHDDTSATMWLATTDDVGVDRDTHEEWLEHLWRRFRWPTHDFENSAVAIDRDDYRVRVAGHLARRLVDRHSPLPELVHALAAAGHLDVLLPLSDDALSHAWLKVFFAARHTESFVTFFERAFSHGDHAAIVSEARAAIACALEEGNPQPAHAALEVVRRLGTVADIAEWSDFVAESLANPPRAPEPR